LQSAVAFAFAVAVAVALALALLVVIPEGDLLLLSPLPFFFQTKNFVILP
jgi:hypothetical protein